MKILDDKILTYTLLIFIVLWIFTWALMIKEGAQERKELKEKCISLGYQDYKIIKYQNYQKKIFCQSFNDNWTLQKEIEIKK